MKWRILFIGIGSIAKRHIKNLREICVENCIEITIDALRRNRKFVDIEECKISNIYTKFEELTGVYDVVFITNPTELHIDTLIKAMPYGKHFFIEKPISSINQIDIAEKIKLNPNSVFYVACPLRYNAVIQYLKNIINTNQVLYVRSISSSYLPDWRPAMDYRETYSAHKNLGGGVSIDLIHEWDYLNYLFGSPKNVVYLGGKNSKLEIDSDDYADYLAEYDNKIISLHLDYFGRYSIREIMLITQDETIVADILNNKIRFLKSNKKFDFGEERDDYQKRELLHFINIVLKNRENDSTISHAIKILKLTQGVL